MQGVPYLVAQHANANLKSCTLEHGTITLRAGAGMEVQIVERLVKFGSMTVVLLMGVVPASPLLAQADGLVRPGSSEGVERLDHVIAASGLSAAPPDGFECEAIASPFASPNRHDGSARRGDRNSGLHGGIDLSLKDGTPLLAVAAGELIAKGEGGQLEGIYLWLRHAPTDTGLPYWVFTKYQHLSALPALKVGDQVRAGQIIAHSGNTGTVSKHYGAAGYPHLHLNTLFGRSGAYSMEGLYGSRALAAGAVLDDPLILYLGPVGELSEVRGLPVERRKVIVPVVDAQGVVHPYGSKTVWPVRCRKNP